MSARIVGILSVRVGMLVLLIRGATLLGTGEYSCVSIEVLLLFPSVVDVDSTSAPLGSVVSLAFIFPSSF